MSENIQSGLDVGMAHELTSAGGAGSLSSVYNALGERVQDSFSGNVVDNVYGLSGE